MKHYTRLNMRERCLIATFLSMESKISTIAQRSGRHRSTIYREIKRNTKKGQHYMPGTAHELAKKRHPLPSNKIDTIIELNKFIFDGLAKRWSPEQISGRMRKLKTNFYACTESIYRYIYKDKKLDLYRLLPRKNPKRRFRISRKPYQKAQLLQRNIAYRPEEINSRITLGHWEGDTIHFSKNQKSCVTTLVERKSRFVCLRKNQNKSASKVIEQIYHIIKSSPRKIWGSITLDQGPEFMEYRFLERKTKCKIFFCNARSPWQRGSNENTNGRLRRFLPNNFKIDETIQEDLDKIAAVANNVPRKCLEYQTPREVFMQHWKTFCRTAL
jgi:transposase, IS30 family